MDYALFLAGSLLKGVLIALLIGVGLNKIDELIQRRRRRRQLTQYKPALRELLIKAQREVDARHGIRR